MFKLAIGLLALSFSITSQAADINEVGCAIGRLFFGSQYVDGTGGHWTMNGEGCSVELKLDADQIDDRSRIHNFHVIGRKGSDVVIINAFRPVGTLKVEKQAASDRILSFESIGSCLGGFSPGSATCDENKDLLIVRKDPQGKILQIKIKHQIDRFFSFPERLSCDF